MFRRQWIAAFIGRVLELGIDVDLDWVAQTAADLYSSNKEMEPAVVADAAFATPSRLLVTLH